jgi:nucleotide-binding universal stress UspA family protein
MARRRSYETGHRPKFLVVIDDTPECERAFHFALRRAARTGAHLLLLTVTTPAEFSNWFGVGDVMREETEAAVKAKLVALAQRARSLADVDTEWVVREGSKSEELLTLIGEDDDVALLILGAGTGSEGPGPLVSTIAGTAAATFPIPIAIVPGHLTDEEIDALA